MLQKIFLLNYKCFANQCIPFKALTLFSGLNGTGKSCVLQSLLLLRQSYHQDLLPDRGLALNGDLVNIGTAQDALFENATEDTITFQLHLKNGHEQAWRFLYDRETDVLSLDNSSTNDEEVYDSSLFSNDFHYLTAERLGPRRFFDMSDFQVHHQRQLGPRGEYTAHFLSIYGDKKVHSGLAHPDAASLDLRNQVEAWLGEISPGTQISVTPNLGTDTISLQYAFVGQEISRFYRATNVGFGITYALPVLVAILSSQPGALVLIENPEAHLHPKGQSQIGKLLAHAAHCGIQIILETHSDHVLNGIRVAVHDGELAPEDVQIHFFQRQKDGQAEVLSPHIDRNGRIDEWPDGFFDEWDKSLESLILPRNM